jgi:hypothetical protein
MSRRRCCCGGRLICPDCFYIFGNNIDLYPDLTFLEETDLTTAPIPIVINLLEDWREISLNINQQQTQENILLYTNKLAQARRLYLAPNLQTRLQSLPSWFRNLQPSEITYNSCSVCLTGACGTTFALIEEFEASCVPLMWGRASGYPSITNSASLTCTQFGSFPPLLPPCFTPLLTTQYYCVDYFQSGIPGNPTIGYCYSKPRFCNWIYSGYPTISGGLQILELVLPDYVNIQSSGCFVCPNSSPGDYSFFPQPIPLPSQQISFVRRRKNIQCYIGDVRTYCGHNQIFTDNTLELTEKIGGEYFHCTKISGYTSGLSGNTYYPCVMTPYPSDGYPGEGFDLFFGAFGCGDPGNSYDCSRCVDLGKDFYEYVHRNVSDDEINIYNKRFSIIRLNMVFYCTSFNPTTLLQQRCDQLSNYSALHVTNKDLNGNPIPTKYAKLTLFYYRPVADCEQQKEADYCFNRGSYELGYVIAEYDGGPYGFSSGQSSLQLKGKALYQSTDGVGEALILQTLGAPPGTLSGTPDMIDRVDFIYPSSIELK